MTRGGAREATHIDLAELTRFFHLPITAVAKELGICVTVLKRICRENGVPRWPYRKVRYRARSCARPRNARRLATRMRQISFLRSARRLEVAICCC